MEQEESSQHLGGIYNYFEGATIHNLVINGSMSKSGNEYYTNASEKPKYSDAQIAQAITAINGSGKILNSKQKWAGVYWGLRWYCNYPLNVTDFCDRVKELPLGDLEYQCDANNFRRIACMSFMNENPRYMDRIKPSNSELEYFMQCREVVLALHAELGKSAPKNVKI